MPWARALEQEIRVAQTCGEHRHALVEDHLEHRLCVLDVDHRFVGRLHVGQAVAADQLLHERGVLGETRADLVAHRGAGGRRVGDARRQQQVHAEGLVGQRAHRADAPTRFLGREARATEHAKASGLRHRGHQRRRRGPAADAHPGQEDRHLDAPGIAEGVVQHGPAHRAPRSFT